MEKGRIVVEKGRRQSVRRGQELKIHLAEAQGMAYGMPRNVSKRSEQPVAVLAGCPQSTCSEFDTRASPLGVFYGETVFLYTRK